MAKISVLALGGLDEKQRRLFVLEIDSKIFILDSGVYEPLNNDFGIKNIVPNLDYLKSNKDKIKAIFLSSANRINIGSLPQIVDLKKDIKIYGSKTTVDSLNIFFGSKTKDWNINYFEKHEEKKIDGINVQALTLTSHIPGTFGYKFKTSDGNVLYLTDYIFDSIREYGIIPAEDIINFKDEKNLLLISDVSKSTESEPISSKFKIKNIVEKYTHKNKRIVISIYEHEIYNVVELINVAKKHKKHLFFESEVLFNLIKKMMDNTEIEKFPIKLFSKYTSANKNDSIVILSGTITKLYLSIEMMIDAEDKDNFVFDKDDIVIMGALPQAGNEHIFAHVSNKISKVDPIVVKGLSFDKKLFGTTEFDLRNYISLLKPKYFMPICGYYSQMIAGEKIAINNGIDSKNILIGNNGEKFEIKNGSSLEKTIPKMNIEPMIVESASDKSIDNSLIEERKSLGKDGIITISFIYDNAKKSLASEIDIQMKGVVISKGQEEVLNRVKTTILEFSYKLPSANKRIKKLVPSLQKSINRIFKETFNKAPTLLFNIIEK